MGGEWMVVGGDWWEVVLCRVQLLIAGPAPSPYSGDGSWVVVGNLRGPCCGGG